MKLSEAARNKIKSSNFAVPGRKYPIEDKSHARNALARVSEFGSSTEKAEVRAKVAKKYPGMEAKKRMAAKIKDPLAHSLNSYMKKHSSDEMSDDKKK